MGVIQSSINQAISAAGQAAGLVKVLGNQKKIGEDVTGVRSKSRYTDEQKKRIRDKQIEREEIESLSAKIRELTMREREQQYIFDRQSTIDKLRNLKDLKERDALRHSPLGGDLNG